MSHKDVKNSSFKAAKPPSLTEILNKISRYASPPVQRKQNTDLKNCSKLHMFHIKFPKQAKLSQFMRLLDYLAIITYLKTKEP